MRSGRSVLLEGGHSYYLEYYGEIVREKRRAPGVQYIDYIFYK